MSLDRVRFACLNLKVIAQQRQAEALLNSKLDEEEKGEEMSLGYARMRELLVRLKALNEEKRQLAVQKQKRQERLLLSFGMLFVYLGLLWLGGLF